MKVGFVSFWEIGTRQFEPIETQWIFPIHEPDGAHTKSSGRIMTQTKPTETFRAFARFAAWAPRQLEAEMLLGACAILPPDSTEGPLERHLATLWQDCISDYGRRE